MNCEKHKTVCNTLNYIEHLLILASTVPGCVLVSVFASLVSIPVGIMSSAAGLKASALTAVIEKKKRKINIIK